MNAQEAIAVAQHAIANGWCTMPPPKPKKTGLLHPELAGLSDHEWRMAWQRKRREAMKQRGLTTMGTPRLPCKHPELKGLSRKDYNRAYSRKLVAQYHAQGLTAAGTPWKCKPN